MKGEYDDFQDNEEAQYAGLGAGKRNRVSKNQQIYGDFYEAYEEEPKQYLPKQRKSYAGAYSMFKAGSKIENYAAECDVHIPQPKKKVKLQQQEEQEIQQPQIGKFNLQSFLRDFQQKEELERIQQEEQEEEYNGPFCLNSKVKNSLKLIRIGEQEDEFEDIDEENMNINEMTFEQYRKLVLRNGKKQEAKPQKKLTAEEREKQKQLIASYGKGYSMLEKMGFNLSKGLGKDEKGITKPVQAVFKTAFTTKDSQLKEEDSKEQEPQTEQEETAAETALFQFRSKNIKINNFLMDLKNKFESVSSKMYFYEREIQQVDRDTQISTSLKLQKTNQLNEYEDEILKLKNVQEMGAKKFISGPSQSHKQELNLKNAHLALKYKMDLLHVKTQFTHLKSLPDSTLFTTFPAVIKSLHKTLSHFYLQKERETIKHYRDGLQNFRDSKSNFINLEEEVIDLVEETESDEKVVSVSLEDQMRINRMIELVAENTVVLKANLLFQKYKRIEDVKDFKLLECLRAIKQINKNSQILKNFVSQKIKPLVLNYYENFDYNDQSKQENPQNLPHLVLFPLFEIMDPMELELSRLLKILSKKLWNLKNSTLHSILKPILQYCPVSEREHFINFYLAPRILYFLEEFDLTQPHICKELMSMIKLYKQFFSNETVKDLLNCTIIPEIVMTYRKYEGEGTRKEELTKWILRWVKEIGKVMGNYLQEVLVNDFNIEV